MQPLPVVRGFYFSPPLFMPSTGFSHWQYRQGLNKGKFIKKGQDYGKGKTKK